LGGTSSEAWRINNSGQVVGDAAAGDGNNHAFLYTDGVGMVNLVPQAATSYGRGISHDGKATGSMTVGNNWRAFRFIPGVGSSDIGVPVGFAHSYGYAINDLGQVAGTVSTGFNVNSTLFRWTPGAGFVVFGSAAPQTAAWAMNASGTVVGRSPVGGVYRPVIFADGLGMVDLNTLINPASGWNLLHATDINDAGQIVGYGHFGPMGETHAFRLDPAPGPSMVFAGPGCASGSPPVLFSTLPHLAQALTLTLTQAQVGLTGAVVLSIPPPFSLPLGGGCVAYVDVGAFATVAPVAIDSAGSWLMTLTIPNDPLLLGAQFALQAVLYPTSGPLGLDLSNGLFGTIGY
jgi:probable HAF family extracellular repeat protein